MNNDGTEIGSIRTSNDPGNLMSVQLFGLNTHTYRPGARLSFGDIGRYTHSGINVFVGEYDYNITDSNHSDSDQLQLHGKNGVFITTHGRVYRQAYFGTDGSLALRGALRTSQTWLSSDKKFKKNIKNIKEEVSKLAKIRPVSYDYQEEIIPLPERPDSFKNEADEEAFNRRLAEAKEHNAPRKDYGLIAQEVQEVYPSLVKEVDSSLAVNYNGFIPILIKANNELDLVTKRMTNKMTKLATDKKVNKLKDRVKALEKLLTDCCSSNDVEIKASSRSGNIVDYNADEIASSTLSQNRPNPFSDITIIDYTLVGDIANSYVMLTDLTGRQVRRIPIQSNSGNVEISSVDLHDGIYHYSLIQNNQVIDTKQMVVAK